MLAVCALSMVIEMLLHMHPSAFRLLLAVSLTLPFFLPFSSLFDLVLFVACSLLSCFLAFLQGDLLVSSDSDGVVRVWDIRRGQQRLEVATSAAHIPAHATVFDPSSHVLVVASEDSTIKVYALFVGQFSLPCHLVLPVPSWFSFFCAVTMRTLVNLWVSFAVIKRAFMLCVLIFKASSSSLVEQIVHSDCGHRDHTSAVHCSFAVDFFISLFCNF